MALPTYETVRDAFATVLNLKISTDKRIPYVDKIIDILNPSIFTKLPDKSIIFDILDKFTPIKITDSGVIKEKTGLFRKNKEINIISNELGAGSYGTVYKTIGENVFKEIKLDTHNPQYLYELLLELFVPTILGLHPEHGKYISNPIKVYYDNTTTNIYIQIKPLQYDMYTYIDTKVASGKEITNDYFFRPIKYISYLLKTFNDDYNFYHNDLHGSNIMFDELDNPQLIDFGMSCITFNGITYTSKPAKICKSYDMLILITSLLEDEERSRNKMKQKFSDELYNILLNSYNIIINETTGEKINIYNNILKLISQMNNNSPIFHGTYYSALNEINLLFKRQYHIDLLNMINTSNYATNDSFIRFINSNWRGIERSVYSGLHASRSLVPRSSPITAGGKRRYSKTYKNKHTKKHKKTCYNKNRKHK